MAREEESLDTNLLYPPSEQAQETSYLFVRVLGRGAFGEAVLYRKTEDNSLVVWKEVNLGRLSEKVRKDAINEIDILSSLNHANVVNYYNHFMDGDTLLIELEYANGGSLHHKIVYQTELFKEEVVKWYLFQLTAALSYIHQNDILHRDIKTMNIFTTKTDLLKLGDFGLSKVLDPKVGMAKSMVGTPYYMSPEIVRGNSHHQPYCFRERIAAAAYLLQGDNQPFVKMASGANDYDYKSDIWALGCVLSEILTLTKTFQATNPLKLAYEIVKGEQGDIDPQYSRNIKDLVDIMLQKDPYDRPTAEDILNGIILNESREEMEKKVWELNSATRRARLQSVASLTETVPIVKSKTSEVYQWGGGKISPQKQDIFVKWKGALQVSAGQFHFAAVTMEKDLYTWANVQGGNQIVGQLGHGDTAAYKAPKKVAELEKIGIIQVSCGDEFTVCVTDEGDVYAFGSDYYGCLGCDNQGGDEVMSPILIDFFHDHPVQEVSCGSAHVVALTKDGDVYTWGSGEFGRLGHGSEDDCSLPRKAKTPGKHLIKHVCAGCDGTFLITTYGRILACGSNEFNKLGFNSQTSGLRKRKPKVYDIPCKYAFSTVKPLTPYHIVSVSAGQTHSAVTDLFGHLYCFGSNKFGQLGVGDFKLKTGICRVRILAGSRVEKVACGDGFTVVSTNDNQVYSWGNGENGRLGALFHDQGKGPNSQSTAMPRPIFGSLQVVPCLFARHWNTVLIAEKVLNQKTLKSRLSSPKLMSVISAAPGQDSAFEDGKINDGSISPSSLPLSPKAKPQPPELDSGIRASIHESREKAPAMNTEESQLPTWLKNEMEDAEFIPIPPTLQDNRLQDEQSISQVGVQSDMNKESHDQLDSADNRNSIIGLKSDRFGGSIEDDTPNLSKDKDQVISELQTRITNIETENLQLKSQLKWQEVKIHSLEQQVVDNSDMLCHVWGAIDQWQCECTGIVRNEEPCQQDISDVSVAPGTETIEKDNKPFNLPSYKTNTKLQWQKYQDHIVVRPYRGNRERRRFRSNSCIENSTVSPFSFSLDDENFTTIRTTSHFDSNANLKYKIEKDNNFQSEKSKYVEHREPHKDTGDHATALLGHQRKNGKKETYC